MEKRSLLRHSINISVITLLSRILGLFRVRLEALVLGGGEIASGWFLAFALPNLFRRLFGEGALGQALIPLVAEAEKAGGTKQVRRELATVFAWLSMVLAGLVIVFSALALLMLKLDFSGLPPYLGIFFRLVPLLMPYTIFMCLTGAMTAVLNYAKVFVLPALGSLLLNIFMIGGLAGFYWCTSGSDRLGELKILSLLVLISGALQLLLTIALLHHYDRFPSFRTWSLKRRPILKDLVKLALPGLLSGSIVQLSFVADRGIASFIGAQAVPALTYVDRLVDLPIGLFAISMSSVLMASMARAAAENDLAEIGQELVYSLRQVLFICIPMAAAILFFHELMLRLLCYGGHYTADDLKSTGMVAIFYSCGIPFFCTLKVIIPCFISRKKVMIPFWVSIAALLLNIVLNLVLMRSLKQGGIALATMLSSLFSNLTLLYILRREGFDLPLGSLGASLFKCAGAAAVAGIVIRYFGLGYCDLSRPWLNQFLNLAAAGAGFVLLYLLIAKLGNFPELRQFFGTFRKSGAR